MAIGMGTSLRAADLTPGNGVSLLNIGPLNTGYTSVASMPSTFTSGNVRGLLGVKVLSGVTQNTLGGLTFVYEVQNNSASGTEGITDFSLGGWAGVQTDVVYGGNTNGSDFFFSPTNTSFVSPGDANRSLNGDTIDFTFPPVSVSASAPPIFAGQDSFQLIVFTDATAWTNTSGTVTTNDFDTSGSNQISDTTNTGSAATYTAVASVPDSGMTALLLGIGLIVLGLFAPRRKLAQA